MLNVRTKGFGVIAHLLAQPSKGDELRGRLIALASLTRCESGCISCEMIENEDSSGEFTLLEEWSSESSHNQHFASKSIRRVLYSLSNLLSGELGSRQHIGGLSSIRYGTNTYNLRA